MCRKRHPLFTYFLVKTVRKSLRLIRGSTLLSTGTVPFPVGPPVEGAPQPDVLGRVDEDGRLVDEPVAVVHTAVKVGSEVVECVEGRRVQHTGVVTKYGKCVHEPLDVTPTVGLLLYAQGSFAGSRFQVTIRLPVSVGSRCATSID